MWRRSSPTEYWRWSANSTEEPRRLLLRSPFIRPTKILRLTSSSCSSLWRNSGSSSGVWAVSGIGRSPVEGFLVLDLDDPGLAPDQQVQAERGHHERAIGQDHLGH